ncbi:hypothetical protein MGG_00916 [Pyricularia oryzae 70-15]|uniref:Host transcription reprogramming factor 5 n=1 Tax=Pyricularia oryzae (strain 70-15 / ATCC MYA-4617 / FGSC 8958) TaxID=242507 RepID=HTR5_PYRO7|nr:uncharacterized protein MGG_00916 [Pyricularia oryzae 70-15]G4NDH1.1 RecName: Full=Host transcription reprogramming factor 5; AltName: Full=Secreted nuclear effector HTR5; Flags: Precursor [Pyricularia oryzae 70-15]EHA48460.1 hypothetical protein MGG_00916 [Pyricularia oryzae 70-15]KAI7921547.1 hypothetical protein M9X92_005322 [Pyricularia oryzae]
MQILRIAQLMALLATCASALPTSTGSRVYSRDVDQTQGGFSGSPTTNSPDSVAETGRLEARSGGSSSTETEKERKKRIKAEQNARIRQEEINRKPYQCPYCSDPTVFSHSDALGRHIYTIHRGMPIYNAKDPRKTAIPYNPPGRSTSIFGSEPF